LVSKTSELLSWINFKIVLQQTKPGSFLSNASKRAMLSV
jgi:hypothetical protein